MKSITKIEPSSARPTAARLRVAAYCRVSTGMDEQLVSLETQKSHYKELISSNPDWDYAGLYYDEGISGTSKEKRSALLQMIADCEAGKIDRMPLRQNGYGGKRRWDEMIARKKHQIHSQHQPPSG